MIWLINLVYFINLAKLFFLYGSKRNTQKNTKIDFESLSQHFEIYKTTISELIPGFYGKFHNFYDYFMKIKLIFNFRKSLLSKKITHLFFCLPYGNLSSVSLLFILKILLPRDIRVIYFLNSGTLKSKITFSKLRIYWYLISKINDLILYYLPQKNIFLMINPPQNLNTRKINKNLYLPFPHFDFDIYKNAINKRNFLVEEKNIVFLDEMYTDHPDIKFFSTTNIENQTDIYYKEVNDFLENISKKFKKKVVIAKHPKHSYQLAEKRYKFQISKNNTVEEVSKAFCVVAHISTSTNMAIMMHKPIIFLETSVHKFYRLHLESLKHLSKDLSCPKIQTFKAYEITKRDLKVDKKKFDIFIKEYISNSLDSRKTNFLLRDYIKKY